MSTHTSQTSHTSATPGTTVLPHYLVVSSADLIPPLVHSELPVSRRTTNVLRSLTVICTAYMAVAVWVFVWWSNSR